jgi:hypothetical protein
LGRKFEAADDLRRALRVDGVTMADPERQEAERKAATWLLAEDPRKAKEFVDSLPPMPRARDFLVVHGRIELAASNVKHAIAQFRAALIAPGSEDANVVRYQLADALLRSGRPEDRLEAQTLIDALQGEPRLPPDYPLPALADRVRKDAAARAAVRKLDSATAEDLSSSLAAVLALGDGAVPWLFHQLGDVARNSTPAAVERRITAVLSILFTDPSNERPPALVTPPVDAPREHWVDFAARAAAWWEGRS